MITRTQGPVLVVESDSAAIGADELVEVWSGLDDDDEVRVAVLHFLDDTFDQADFGTPVEWPSLPLSSAKPVIAAIEGHCSGRALELALACDLRIAAEDAVFGLPNRTDPFKVASVLLPRMTSAGFALEVLLSGSLFTAAEFVASKLVNRITPPGRVLETSVETATELARRFDSTSAFRKRELLTMSGQPLAHVMTTLRTTHSRQ